MQAENCSCFAACRQSFCLVTILSKRSLMNDPHNMRHYCVTPHLWPTSCVWASTETYFSKTSGVINSFHLCSCIFLAYANYADIQSSCTIPPCVAVFVSFSDVVSPAWMVGSTLSGLGWIYCDGQRRNQLCSKSRVLFVSVSVAACWPTGGQNLKRLWKCIFFFM